MIFFSPNDDHCLSVSESLKWFGLKMDLLNVTGRLKTIRMDGVKVSRYACCWTILVQTLGFIE